MSLLLEEEAGRLLLLLLACSSDPHLQATALLSPDADDGLPLPLVDPPPPPPPPPYRASIARCKSADFGRDGTLFTLPPLRDALAGLEPFLAPPCLLMGTTSAYLSPSPFCTFLTMPPKVRFLAPTDKTCSERSGRGDRPQSSECLFQQASSLKPLAPCLPLSLLSFKTKTGGFRYCSGSLHTGGPSTGSEPEFGQNHQVVRNSNHQAARDSSQP